MLNLQKGDKINRFEICEDWGRRADGWVYEALDARLGRRCYIKFLDFEAESILGDYEKALKDMGRLNHPNIERVYEISEFQNSPYLVLEWFPGPHVSKYLDRVRNEEDDSHCESARVRSQRGRDPQEYHAALYVLSYDDRPGRSYKPCPRRFRIGCTPFSCPDATKHGLNAGSSWLYLAGASSERVAHT